MTERASVPSRHGTIVVLCPHFSPDTAPTGTVMTRIVEELVELGYRVHVVTSLPWYRAHAIEPGWGGRRRRTERTPWGSITRVDPFPGDDKSNLIRRAFGFVGYSVLAGAAALRVGERRRVDAVIAMSPPLTLGLTGWVVATWRSAPLIFNIQDVFPDAAVTTGAITNRWVIAAASWLERVSYRLADAVTVLSDDLRTNVVAKLPSTYTDTVHVIPNFVDTVAIAPGDRDTAYRRELGLGIGPVVMYAGNVGFSQSLELVVAAAERLPDIQFVINGEGAARNDLAASSAHLTNLHFAPYVDADRLAELLASADLHVVPLRRGLGSVSVPSKTYSILAAGRPVVAAIDAGTAVPRILEASGAGVAVAPDDADAFTAAIAELLASPSTRAAMGLAGRSWVVSNASPAAVGQRYSELIGALGAKRRGGGRSPGARSGR
ncbi:MAG: glycosyltransferase family 4 protein [Actinomycetota bacterium]